MDRLIIVEILGRTGKVAHRVRIEGVASVGRAYDNDVIIDDPFVDPHALEISLAEDGSVVARDLGTTNGVFVSDGERLGEVTAVRPGDILRLGRTRLRVVRSDMPVPPALPDAEGTFSALAASRIGLPVALLTFLVCWALISYNTEVNDFTAAVLVTELLGFLALFAAWAGAWALGARLASGRARFREHAAIAVALLVVWMPLSFVLGVVAFMWPGDFTDFLGVAGGIAVGTMLIYAHLGVSSRMHRRRRGLVAASVVLALVGLSYLGGTIDPEPEVPVQGALGTFMPLPANLIPTADLDDFLDAATTDLQSDLEEEATS